MHLKITYQNWWILFSHFNIENGRKCTLSAYSALLFQESLNTTETWKMKRFVHFMEKVLWLIEFVKSGLWSFVLEISPWTMLRGRVDQLKLIAIETLIEVNQHYTVQGIANTLKISKSIKLLVKLKNVSFILWKKHTGFLANPIYPWCYKIPCSRMMEKTSLVICLSPEKLRRVI